MNNLVKQDIVGNIFGELLVLKRVEKPSNVAVGKYTYWLCKCVCGKELIVSRYSLTKNKSKISCGCVRKPNLMTDKVRKIKPDSERVPKTIRRLRNIWYGMKLRCFDDTDNQYHNYGGKGIKVCDEWLNFEAFKSDMYESYLQFEEINGTNTATIDRLDNNKPYTYDNCKWATQLEQARNRSTNIKVTIEGTTYRTLSEVAETFKINYDTIRTRYSRGLRGLELVNRNNIKNTNNITTRNINKKHYDKMEKKRVKSNNT